MTKHTSDMNDTTIQRIELLRDLMRREHIGAFITPTSDPHNSEYTPEHWKCREWLSGFNGSAGTIVVTDGGAALWTDSRYFIAAAQQLEGTGIKLMRQGVAGTPSIAEWIGAELGASTLKEVAINGENSTCAEVESLAAELRRNGGLTLRTNIDPFDTIWTDRPPMPDAPVEVQPLKFAGEDVASKLSRIRRELRKKHADGILVSALDDIAWTLNLRGGDVHCTPVFVSYLLISTTRATLFVNPAKLNKEVRDHLLSQGVDIDEYDNVAEGIGRYEEYNILLDPDSTNFAMARLLKRRPVVLAQSPIPTMKSLKNEVEINGFRNAMLRDGVALVRFLRWLKPAVERGGESELTVSRRLFNKRKAMPLFRDISFDTIAAYEAHGAIVHYEPTEESDAPLRPTGLLLIDSGAQYQDGTTDITRTIALGTPTEHERRIYTLVLKSHIQLELAKFPSGACGSQIDAMAKAPLWREGMNFFHGTGHGVGSYLNVHEGPHQIRMNWIPEPLVSGMTVTDEPGIYLEGEFGVRIENVLLTRPYRTTPFGDFLEFEPLTLCPIDTTPIDLSLMTAEEIAWLNAYHQTVFDRLSPMLDSDDKTWLKDATKPL